ncbi:MAG: proline dehydrogenase family protein [Ignavibacteriales bacterium]|nr:proline dehydrogenase family protein [Ignavibacteriales bacterium]
MRLVKGAYKEPPDLAYPKKADVDENFFRLSVAMLDGPRRKNGFRPVFGTHDAGLIARIRAHAERAGLAARDVEVHMLYGIQRAEQERLVKEGAVVAASSSPTGPTGSRGTCAASPSARPTSGSCSGRCSRG